MDVLHLVFPIITITGRNRHPQKLRDLKGLLRAAAPEARHHSELTREEVSICGVCLKISERNWLGPACVETSAGRSAGGIPPKPPFRTPRLEPERKGRFQVFLWRQILVKQSYSKYVPQTNIKM